DFVPAAWDYYDPTFWDWSTYLGTIGLFLSLLFLFIRLLPMISIFEMRELVAEQAEEEEAHHGQTAPGEDQGKRIPATRTGPALYGLRAEYEGEEPLLAALRRVCDAAYRRVEAYTPCPVEGMASVLGVRGRRLPLIVLGGGII